MLHDGFCIRYSLEFFSAFLRSSAYLSMIQDGAIARKQVLGPVVIIRLNAPLNSLLKMEYIRGLKLELEYPSQVRTLNAVGGMHS